ncbi:MAG: leucyl aminopeptidase [Gammaproteobacteria bacterium]|nr:leucyl aminopeptidase [Gammaproteobacteria bacterium]
MEFFATSGSPEKARSSCAIAGVFQDGRLSSVAKRLDKASGGVIGRTVRRGDIAGKPGDVLLLTNLDGLKTQRVLLVGCGPQKSFGARQYRKALEAALGAIARTSIRDAVSYLSCESVSGTDSYYLARYGVEAAHEALYRFLELKTEGDDRPPALGKLGFAVNAREALADAERGVAHGAAIVIGMELTRRLGNLPPNICTPAYLADRARQLAREEKKIATRIVDEAAMKKLGMGGLLAVTSASDQPAKLIVIEYRGGANGTAPVALVGKGVTFDTGGISIKPAAAMDEMKFDMCGAASVFGTLLALARLELPLNVVGIVPTCENMPGGTATRPGDIVRTMSGRTVEILNTDAEGRMILCDALTYARRFNPETVIDIATLTGACVIALGTHITGLMSNDETLAGELLEAGGNADDRAWRLPLGEEYAEQLKSNFADLANVAGREGGAITAACFLAKFTDGLRWAHLDVAGTAYRSGKQKGATGRPVPLLMEFLIQRANGAR